MNCPLCGKECKANPDHESNTMIWTCNTFNRSFRVDVSMYSGMDDQTIRKMYNLIFEHVLEKPYADEQRHLWWFLHDRGDQTNDADGRKVNLANMHYPMTLAEKTDRILLNLYHYNQDIGYGYSFDSTLDRALFSESEQEEKCHGIAQLMQEMGYLTSIYINSLSISTKGWQRIEELIRNQSAKRQAFIAISFQEEAKTIQAAIEKGIVDAHYSPLTINQKEHNNQIVPEIFYEIDQSKFLVMDVTYPNNGAFYEAGYARGKGKPIIICCNEKNLNAEKEKRPHFDIAQQSMVVWKDEADLSEKLKKRIEATIPENV